MSIQDTLARIGASGLPLQGKLDALKHEFETNMAPPEVVAVMKRVTQGLVDSGQAGRALTVGDRAPPFALTDTDGEIVTSDALLAKGPLVLTFYRGIWCPYCNFDLAALEEARPELERRGANLVAVSQQTAANNRKTRLSNGLGYPVLTDTSGQLADRFGLRWTVPDDLKAIHKLLGADLELFNGESSWTLPMPARYAIGQDGLIAYAEVNPDYTRRPEPSAMFPALDALAQRPLLRRSA